jgi:hypothetical protein
LRFLGLLSAGLLLMGLGTLEAAEEMADSTVNIRQSIGFASIPNNVRVNDAPKFYQIMRNENTPIPLPKPVGGDDPGGLSAMNMPAHGPTATTPIAAADFTSVAAGFIPARGSAMSSPKQQADRAINRLIRNLH